MTCPICQRRPLATATSSRMPQTCGKPRCVGILVAQKRSPTHTAPALAAYRQQVDARMRAVVDLEFGPLSERERALFQHVWTVAYKRGYALGRQRTLRIYKSAQQGYRRYTRRAA